MFNDSELLWLLGEIIDSIKTADIEDLTAIYLLEEDIDPETGIPIGNYLSQYSGNYYFSSFDHWLKEEKHVKDNYRYMDDITIFGKTKEELFKLKEDIDIYFSEELKLTVKSNWQVFPTYIRGVDFFTEQNILQVHTFEKINLSGNGKENDRYQEQSGSREHDELFRVVFNQFLQRLVEIC